MKNFIKNNYHKHLGLGLLFGNYLSMLILILFPQTNIFVLIITNLIIGGLAGYFWEEGQMFINPKVKRDWWDIIFSSLGFALGSVILGCFFLNVKF